MPYRHHIHPDRDLLEITFWGDICAERADRLLGAVRGDPRFHTGLRVLYDYRRADRFPGAGDTEALMTAMATADAGAGARRAVLGGGTRPAQGGLADRVASSAASLRDLDISLRFFEDRAAALEWLLGKEEQPPGL